MELTPEQLQQVTAAATDYGWKALIAVAIWFVGTTLGKIASNGVRHALGTQDGIAPSVARFVAKSVSWLALAIVVIAILNLFGINTTSVAAMLGALTLAIGLALRDTIANFAAGVMILLFRTFSTDDFIEVGGHTGTVQSINLFNTELATLDNVQILVPNSEAWKSPIKNYSAYDRRRMDLVIGVDYRTDLDQALAIIRRLVDADPRTLHDPEPFVRVTELAASSVNITIRVWCRSEHLFDLKFDLTKRIKERFDAAGIAIPFPHLEIIQKPQSEPTPRPPGRLTSSHH